MGDDVVVNRSAFPGGDVADGDGVAARRAIDRSGVEEDVAADVAKGAVGFDVGECAVGDADGIAQKKIVLDVAAGAGLDSCGGGVGDDVTANVDVGIAG